MSIPEPTPDSAYTFPPAFQRRILAMMVFDAPNLRLYEQTIKPEYFESRPFRDIAKIILDFYGAYDRPPSPDELLQRVGELVSSTLHLPEEEYIGEYQKIIAVGQDGKFDCARDEVEKFAKYEAVRTALLESAGILKSQNNLEGIRRLIEKGLEVGSSTSGLEVIPLAQRGRKATTWFWHNKIPKGKLSLIVGDPGVGKSYFMMFITSAVTTGRSLPPTQHQLDRGRVIIISAEDGIDDTIVPRIEDNHGDKTLVDVVRGTKEGRLFSLAKDLLKLENLIKNRPDTKLIIIDPVSAYFSAAVDTHKDTSVRSVLDPLAILAEKYDVTIIGVMHLNKSQVLSAIYRVSGSTAFVAAARSVWAITREKREGEDQTKRYFTPIKTNLSSGDEPGLVWKINDQGAVEFPNLGALPPPLETQLAPPAPRKPTKAEKAREFLMVELEGGPEEAANLIFTAKAEGISEKTLKRAKEELGLKAEKAPTENGPWFWMLPGQTLPAPDPDEG